MASNPWKPWDRFVALPLGVALGAGEGPNVVSPTSKPPTTALIHTGRGSEQGFALPPPGIHRVPSTAFRLRVPEIVLQLLTCCVAVRVSPT